MAPKELSAFELKRRQNIDSNRELLGSISDLATKIVPSKSASEPSRKTRRAPRRATPVARVQPVRQSSRIKGLAADNDSLKRQYETDVNIEREKERVKRSRVAGDLVLGDISISGSKWDGGLGGLQSLQVGGAQPGVRTWDGSDVKDDVEDDGDDKSEDGIKALRRRLNKLKLYEKWEPNEIKITPQRIYSLGLHPTEDKPIIFAGDKEGAMGVFDASQAKDEPADDDEDADQPIPVISVFKAHARTISAFVFSSIDSNAVYSASYDSSIRKVDLSKGVSTQVYAPADASVDQAISAMEIPEMDPNVVFFSTLDGDLGRHDIRTPASQVTTWSVSEHKIGGFALHPTHSHLVATASLDRTMRIWDVRKIVDDVPVLVGSHESRLSVSHASWSSAGHVATTSYDDTIKIHSFGDAPAGWNPGHVLSEDEMRPTIVVKHNNQTGRWVTILKPHWQRRPRDGVQRLVVGNMNRFVDVFAEDGSQVAQLGGDGITAVPAVAHFHPTMEWIAGGTGSGKLCIWT